MAGIITPSGLVNELTVIADDDTISEVNVPGEAFNRKVKKSVEKTYYQETMPVDIAANRADIAGIKAGTEQLNPRSFTSGRFDSQELVSGTLSVAGWYTIAETEATSVEAVLAELHIMSFAGRGASVKIGLRPTTTARTHGNSTIKIINNANTVEGVNSDIQSVRIVKSDTVDDGGFKVQVLIDGGDTYYIQLVGNIGRGIQKGLFLVTPYIDNTPTLPDGVTTGTFLEAGEELRTGDSKTIITPKVTWTKIDNDNIELAFNWDETPKQGTSIALNYSSFVIYDLLNANVPFTGAESFGVISIDGEEVLVTVTRAAAFGSLVTGGLVLTNSLIATIS